MIDVVEPRVHSHTYSGTVQCWTVFGATYLIGSPSNTKYPFNQTNLAIFGSSEGTLTLPHHCKQALRIGMVAAKKLILLNWKSPSPPCFKRWLNEMVSISRMEQNRFNRGKAPNYYEKAWKPFLALLDET